MCVYVLTQFLGTVPGPEKRYHCRRSYLPNTSEANLKKVGRKKQGRDSCSLTAVGSNCAEERGRARPLD